MKYISIFTVLPLAAALPADVGAAIVRSEALQQLTDRYMFSISLPAFTDRRNARDPATVDWSTDGCTSAPDNPFGFPFVPGCHRHDFGYRNFRAQSRFTSENRLRIDDIFKKDLLYQCDSAYTESSFAKTACHALAHVYYVGVRAFGGGDATKRKEQEDLVAEYNKAVAAYDAAVKEAQDKGELPILAN